MSSIATFSLFLLAAIMLFIHTSGFQYHTVRPELTVHEKLHKLYGKELQLNSQGVPLLAHATRAASSKHRLPISKAIANIVGYFMGYGSVCLYLPIIFDLYRKRNADGVSVATWVTSLIGLALSAAYPLQKKFPISTYLEFLVLSAECYMILGAVCSFKKLYQEFFGVSLVFFAFVGTVLKIKLPEWVLSAIQVLAMVSCNYALVPQIILNIERKTYGWSEITALLSTSGNALRIFTTLQLTKDPLILVSYLVGFVVNLLIFLQYFIYPKS